MKAFYHFVSDILVVSERIVCEDCVITRFSSRLCFLGIKRGKKQLL